MERYEKVDAPPVISGGDPAPLLGSVECPSDQVPLAVQLTVVFPRLLSSTLGRYDCRGSPGPDEHQYPIARVTHVSDNAPASMPVSRGSPSSTWNILSQIPDLAQRVNLLCTLVQLP